MNWFVTLLFKFFIGEEFSHAWRIPVAIIVLAGTFYGVMLYVIAHFISKFW